MDNRVVIGAGALLLLAALVGVLAFTSDEADTQPLAYPVTWALEPGPSTTRSDTLEEGRNETYTFELSRPNVTRVTVRLNWTDDVGDPDRFRVRAVPPNGSPAVNESTNGSVTLPFDVAVVPTSSTVTGESEAEARNRTLEEATDAGQGAWQVRVTLLEAPGRRPVAEAPQLETEPDGSNGYNLTFAHRAFHAELGDPQPPGSG